MPDPKQTFIAKVEEKLRDLLAFEREHGCGMDLVHDVALSIETSAFIYSTERELELIDRTFA